jgi:hypothetical protein
VNQDSATATQLRHYLLGELDEHERARVEEQYFGDDGAFDELLVVEDELIDAYVADRLTPAEQRRFEKLFLTTPSRRERVAFARSLRKTVTPSTMAEGRSRGEHTKRFSLSDWWRSTGAWRWSMAAATVALLIGASWLAVERRRLQDEIATLQTQSSALAGRAQQLQGELEAARNRGAGSATTPAIASFLLTPRLSRDGAQGNVVRLASGTALVQLQLELEADTHPRYRPVLQTVSGEPVWSQQAARASVRDGASFVTVELPASLLANRGYVLSLQGEGGPARTEEVAAYFFQVSRE